MLSQLGRYRIEELIGEGTFARVYRAMDVELARQVALKVLKSAWLSDPAAVARFKQEARTMARLDKNPHIAVVYDVGEDQGQVYLAQLLVDGETLTARLTRGPLAWPEVLDILRDIATALDYAHSQGVIHRDIKPSNILLDKDGQTYLGDFGLVRAAEGSASLSRSVGGVKGTASYIPPEVWDGEEAKPASDVYALSCVIFEMLTGQVLFEGSSMMQVMRKHDQGPQFPEQWPPGVPSGVTEVLQRGLAKNPRERYNSAGELVKALATLSTSPQPVATERLEPPTPPLPPQAEPIVAPPTTKPEPEAAKPQVPPTLQPKPVESVSPVAVPTTRTAPTGGRMANMGLLMGGGVMILLAVCGAISFFVFGRGAAPTPERVVVVETVIVEKDNPTSTPTPAIIVTENPQTGIVTKEVEKVVTVEVKEEDPNILPSQETLYYGGSNVEASDITTLDPARVEDSPSIQFVSELFVGVTKLNEATGASEPGIATEWSVSDGGLVYTFKLRENVPWVRYNNATNEVEQVVDDQGKPRLVNANDFVYGIRRTLDPKTGSSYAYVNWVIKNAQEVNGGAGDGEQNPLYGKIDEIGIRAVNDFTLEFRLKEPAGYFSSIASMWINYAQPQWLIEERGDRWIEAGVIQSYGPYALKEWIHNVSITLIANPFWPGNGSIPKPSIKFIHSQFLDESAQFADYEADKNDVSIVPLPELDRVKADPALNAEFATPGILCTYYYGFNVTKPPFDDVNVRKAFSWAIDRTALIEEVTRGGQIPARWFSRPGLTAAPDPKAGDDFGPPVKAEVEKAKEFLASSRYPTADKMPEITLMSNQVEGHVKIAEAIQQMWQENLGVKVNLVTQEWKVFLQTRYNNPPQIARNGWCQDYPDTNNFLRDVFRSDSPQNNTRWVNEEFDKLVDQAARETDSVKRKELYIQAEKILVEQDVAIIPLYWYTRLEVTKPYLTRTYSVNGQESFEKWKLNKP